MVRKGLIATHINKNVIKHIAGKHKTCYKKTY